jgi:aurora kinase, other
LAQVQQTIDIGSYDGGFDNDKRGTLISGEAAEVLTLDSSTSMYVDQRELFWADF